MNGVNLSFPFALSPSRLQPFVLSLSQETADLRTGLSTGENLTEHPFMLRRAQHERQQ